KARTPIGSPYSRRRGDASFACRATRLAQTANGKWSSAGWLTRNAPRPASHGSGSLPRRAGAIRLGPGRGAPGRAGFCGGRCGGGGRGAGGGGARAGRGGRRGGGGGERGGGGGRGGGRGGGASARVDGRRWPGGSRPSTMASR